MHNEPRLADRVLSYLILIQVLGVFFGWALLALGVGIWEKLGRNIKPPAEFLRDWGFIALLIPMAWLGTAIYLSRHSHGRFDGQLIFWSGIAVAIVTFVVMSGIGLSSGATLITVAD